jgi:thiamine pyrophosphokinase
VESTNPVPATARRAPATVPGRRLAVVIAGGEGVEPAVLRRLPAERIVIAADSGLDTARAAGVTVDILIGDLDSVSAEGLAAAAAEGVVVDRHPVDKDRTDLDLALQRVVDDGFTECALLGGAGGRLSHLLANAGLVAAERYAGIEVRWLVGATEAQVARPGRDVVVEGAPGDLVSLLAAADPATGVSTTGLRWALDGAVLEPGSTRGVSNQLTGGQATVTVSRGSLLVIHEPAGEERRP